MKERTFNEIRELVYQRSGITLGENKHALVRARIAKRMRRLSLTTYEDYMQYLQSDTTGTEMEQMLDAISTNTTHFYREAAHFDLMRQVVKGWLNGGMHRLRVWSAASSTGEEPYTLAFELREATANHRVDMKILATDIAPSVLKTAITGEYSEDKIEAIPRPIRTRYFTKIKSPRGEILYKVRQDIRDMILFRQFNLSVVPYPLNKQIDIIFCRNVMIYFDRNVRSRLIGEFHRLLRPGGYLFVGHAESITGYSKGFKCLKPSVYVRE